jgi:hypothetical protein
VHAGEVWNSAQRTAAGAGRKFAGASGKQKTAAGVAALTYTWELLIVVVLRRVKVGCRSIHTAEKVSYKL